MTTTTEPAPATRAFTLSDDDLDRFAARTADYDREGRFFHEDLEDLRTAGYLTLTVPQALGGKGRSLLDVVREQRRLAYRSPSTALAVNMHLYWTGIAADRHRAGDHELDWILEEAVAGRIFAAGHGERDNDLVIDDSTTRALPEVDGGYRFTGHKIFGSLSPVWDWFGLHGRDDSDPDNPMLVHAFVAREADGIEIKETWNTVGLRATRSEDTLLDDVRAEPQHVARVFPVGVPSVTDPFIASLYAWSLLGISSVYHGVAQRAVDLAVEHARTRTSRRLGGDALASDGFVQTQIARLSLLLQQVQAHIESTAAEWDAGVPHGELWPALIVGAKVTTAEHASQIVHAASVIVGGGSLFKGHELERIQRDVLGAAHHPAQAPLAHWLLASTALGASAAGRLPSGAQVRVRP